MGNDQPIQQRPRQSLEDSIIQMKIQSKQIQRTATNSQKQSQKYMKRAKQSLKKNNQQNAKLFLVSASSKRTEALNYQRTATKMDIMCNNIKSMKANQKMVNTFGNMAHLVSAQMNQLDPTKMSNSLNLLNTKMDQMMINGKMMQEIMGQNDGVHSETVDQMMNVLKQQITMENTNNLNQIPGTYNYNQANKENISNDSKGLKDNSFFNQLKGL